MRDRLIELIKNAEEVFPKDKPVLDIEEFVADYLLAKGVTVPPCKVGDITYVFDYEVNNHLEAKFRGIVHPSVEEITIDSEGVWVDNGYAKYHETAFGDIIFLTREEAEQALAKMKGGAE